jgi:hypothetical protein
MDFDFEQAKKEIISWVVDFVEKPNPLLNGWAPCPYARRARVDGKFDIRAGFSNPISDCAWTQMDSYDVIAYVYPSNKFSAEAFNNLVNNLNDWHLIPRGMLALADHPADVESVNGAVMNQGTYAICFLQNLQKLNEHARMLADKGFYNGWPEDYLNGLFRGRQDPRL